MPQKTCENCLVKDRSICGAGTDEAQVAVRALARAITVAAGTTLADEGIKPEVAVVIRSGAVRLHFTLMDGRRQSVGLSLPGETVGLAPGTRGAETVNALDACVFPRRALLALLDAHPSLARHVLEAAWEELAKPQRRMLMLGRRSALERVAAYLDGLCEHAGVMDGTVTMPLSRTDMADMLGLTLETVSRSMTRLRDVGAVEARGRDIGVLDRQFLIKLAA